MEIGKMLRRRRRRGVAAIIGAVILFSMLFTVGTGYFLYVNQNNLLYNQSLSNRANSMQSQLTESASVSAQLVGNLLGFTVTNTGAIPINVTGLFVATSSGTTTYFGKSAGIGLPFAVNPGATSSVVNSGVSYQSSVTYTLKALTSRGNVFTATFPLNQQQQNVQLSGVTQGLGSIVLKFGTFRFYSTDNGPKTVGDGWEVGGFYGFNIPNGIDTLFQGAFENLDPLQRSITVDMRSSLYQSPVCVGGCGGGTGSSYFIVGDITNYPNCNGPGTHSPCVGAAAFTKLTFGYGKTILMNFSAPNAGVCVGPGPGCQNAQNSINGVAPIFLELFGNYSDRTLFGQTIPFVASYGTGVSFAGPLLSQDYVSGTRGHQVTLGLTGFTVAPRGMWTWSNGSMIDQTYSSAANSIQVTIPSGATVGNYYTVMVFDGVNAAYAEIKVTG